MSAVTDIPKGLPKPIKFEDIKVGDKIRAVFQGRTTEGVVGDATPFTARTVEGAVLATSEEQIYLLERPAPPEPKGLGAVVEARVDYEVDRRRFIAAGDGLWYDPLREVERLWAALHDPVVLHEGYVE